MPRRNDIKSILIIGSGPIVIGQACEFDYSGTQACRVLRDEGYRVILANSNPATIMTDPDFADATYIEPLTLEVLTSIIEKERPDAVLPTLGGQTALNLGIALAESGVLERYGVEMIGATPLAIKTAENRDLFKAAMGDIGLAVPESGFAYEVQDALTIGNSIGFPIMIRPSFILGGAGTGIAHDAKQLAQLAEEGLRASPVGEILVEQSIAGWKEYELEVMRDHADNVVIVCAIENFDPMGVHTGDSITVAPAQTLSDVEYQTLRDAALKIMRRIGVDTGGSNVQFAVNPANGDYVVIEMNPRVSRSSALASKATGFPIAKIAARLAVGYTLDEIPNDITKMTPASFEPSIDYVVTKIPRWAFEKLPGQSPVLGTRMQSVGEVMAIGRNFAESWQKALRSIERGRDGFGGDAMENVFDAVSTADLLRDVAIATPERPFQLEALFRRGVSADQLHDATKIDLWFLRQLEEITTARLSLADRELASLTAREWRYIKQLGFTDKQLSFIMSASASQVTSARLAAGVNVTYHKVDTCAAEFAADTPYMYSSYGDESEVAPSAAKKVIILGSGPNRIGQGIEFDYCCVHASFALRAAGYETIMVNCNPETVSTDYDTSSRLYFEPLTLEDVCNVIESERRSAERGGGELVGVIVGLGGQTPLKLASLLDPSLILGTTAASIDGAEDRQTWSDLCARLEIPQPAGATAETVDQALAVTARIGYPCLVRPSYVLGGRGMRLVYDDAQLTDAFQQLLDTSLRVEGGLAQQRAVLIDRFLEDAIEVDVDAIRDHTGDIVVGGVMEHVEQAGIHSGDSACALPPQTLAANTIDTIKQYATSIADALDVVGPINVQFAVKSGQVFVIEANPRASRTMPFVAKATGIPMAKIAARVMVGATLEQLAAEGLRLTATIAERVSVKSVVLPFSRFPDVDTILGPEMRSTGEVMGVDVNFGASFAKSSLAAGSGLPVAGNVFISIADRDKVQGLEIARALSQLGFQLAATVGTASYLAAQGLVVDQIVAKVASPFGTNVLELISNSKIALVINTPRGGGSQLDGAHIRKTALRFGVPCLTTLAAASAAVAGIRVLQHGPMRVRSLQEWHSA
jgi:carbamoyl-phosphate synthase large subunit